MPGAEEQVVFTADTAVAGQHAAAGFSASGLGLRGDERCFRRGLFFFVRCLQPDGRRFDRLRPGGIAFDECAPSLSIVDHDVDIGFVDDLSDQVRCGRKVDFADDVGMGEGPGFTGGEGDLGNQLRRFRAPHMVPDIDFDVFGMAVVHGNVVIDLFIERVSFGVKGVV